ncbi:hypothetical protein [Acididesulfobacillus acetoxydans]|uniref:hypothetical protein n=1 Tax=Acididesulfobacillus acetoxydans TaxID=1561005 RepID=UPI0021BFB6AB|nr:hypothetical protein [Acididesulfobacillus acetoxydans]
MINSIFKGSYTCSKCGETHNWINVNDYTTIKEFSVNYYLPGNDKCGYAEEDRYCVLVKWKNFCADPLTYIEKAFEKREAEISEKVISLSTVRRHGKCLKPLWHLGFRHLWITYRVPTLFVPWEAKYPIFSGVPAI